jgi:ketosteroid isomerase-like protein
MAEHPNVALVRKALEHVAQSDAEGVVGMWSDDMSYYAFDESGPPAEFLGHDEFLDMMRNGRKMMRDHSYEIIDIRPVGEELVVAHLRMHATSSRTGESVVGEYLGVYRIRNGQLVMGCDFVNPETEKLMEETWA